MPIKPLKIVHINTHDIAGGAAKVAWRLAEAQRRNGHDARMLVGIKTSRSEFSTAFDPLADLSKQDEFSNEGLLYYEFLGSHNLVFHPLIRDADVIHLHNLHGNYFNYFSIPLLAAKKPVVWTLHDMHAFTGHCAHSFDCQRWKIGCGSCPRLDIEPAVAVDRTREMLAHKRSIYEHSALSIVSPSKWLHEKVQCSVLSGQHAEYISNGVDTAVFKPYPRIRARQRFNLPVDALLIGASAHGGALANQWKGGETTLSVLHNILPQHSNAFFINIGSDSLSDNDRIINIPHQQDEASLAEAYSCLDMMLYTPIADNCPLVVLEALSCGVPMVTTHTGGVPELVQDGVEGFVVADRDVNSLSARIGELLASNQLRTDFSLNARKKAVRFFDHSEMALNYEALYNHSISQWKANCHPERFGLADYPPPEILTRHYEAAVHEVSEYAVLKEATPMDCSPANLPTLSLVVATKNRAQLLDGMLASARESARSISMEIIAIDGGSDDRTLEVLTAHHADVILNEHGELGPGRHSWPELYNCGFSKARGKWTMYASDDIEFGPGCLDNAIQVLESCDDSVAGGIFYYRNDVAEPGWDQFGIDYTYGRKMLMNYGVVRTEHFRGVQGLDEAYQFYCADGDLCLKLYQRGYQLVPLHECFVMHHNTLDAGKQINLGQADGDIQLYRERWGHIYSTDLPTPRRLFWQLTPEKNQADSSTCTSLPASSIKLHLGCGQQYLDGYINIDYPPDLHNIMAAKADVYADITTLSYPDGSVDEIRLHHVFEHFSRVTALALLMRWHSWLRIGGTLHIETPDIEGCAKIIASDAADKTKMGIVRHLAGDQAAPWGYHIDHWYPQRFVRTLHAFGFNPVETSAASWTREPYLGNVHAIAIKDREMSTEELLLAADELLWDSTIDESERNTWEIWRTQLRAIISGVSLTAPCFEPKHQINPAASIAEIHDFNQISRDRWVAEKAAEISAGAYVLDVGAGTCPYRTFFAHCNYAAHDFKGYSGPKLGGGTEYGDIDFVSEITAIPAPDASFDIVICTEVLEHVPEPIAAMEEMARILKPGGKMLLTAPLGSGLHQLPYHYYGGFTPQWYTMAAERCSLTVKEITPNGGFFKLLAQECARVSWTFEQHAHLHGDNAQQIFKLFHETLPRYLFDLDDRCFIDQFTVGYFVELYKPYPGEILQGVTTRET